MTYKLSFRIRKIYFDQIIAGTKTVEVRRKTPFWTLRVVNALNQLWDGVPPQSLAVNPVICVFVCGKEIHRRYLRNIFQYKTAEQALGRPPSKQGLKDIGEGPVFGFHLGEVVKELPCGRTWERHIDDCDKECKHNFYNVCMVQPGDKLE